MSDTEYKPLEGDPDLLKTKAQHYANIAEAITRSVKTLHKIHDVDSMKSKATSQLRDKSESVANDINKAQDRYAITAKALITYSGKLRDAQDAATIAIAHINAKQEDADSASHAAAQAKQKVQDSTDADKSADQSAANTADDDAQSANTALSHAHGEWHDALDAKNAAANVAIKAIVEVVDGKKNHGLKDSWWDNWGATLFSILKVVCKWAGVLAIFLAWVPILGEVLLVLAAVGAIIDVVEATIAAINGDGSWWAVVGAAATAVLTIFGGKIFAMAAKNLKALTIVKSGVTDSRALAEMQGVGRHSAEFMSGSKAADQLSKPLSDVFKAPFVRSEASKAAMAAYKDGSKSASQLVKDAAKEAFPGLKGSLTKGLNINKDMLSFYKMAAKSPQLVDLPTAVTGAAATAYQAYRIESAGQTALDPTSYMEGEYGTVVDAVKDTAGVVHNSVSVSRDGTTAQ